MKQVAVIDLGTNTFNLLIARESKKGHSVIYKNKIPVKLGEGGIQNNILTEAAIERGLSALEQHKLAIDQHGITQVKAIATSAIRSASNSKVFVEKVFKRTGFAIDVISGEKEATYIFNGVCNAMDLNKTNSLIVDIGGGSTEFIITIKGDPVWKASFDLGVARLLSMHRPSDPITGKELRGIQKQITNTLEPLFSTLNKYPVNELIGSSGSFDSITNIILHQYTGKGLSKKEKAFQYDLSIFKTTLDQIMYSSHRYRSQLKGLVDYRVDTIVIACLQIMVLLHQIEFSSVRHSSYSLREGVLGDMFN